MSIDINSLLGSTQLLQVVRVTYDFARDGGGLYARPIGSAVIPSDSVLVYAVALCTAAITFTAGGSLYLQVDGVNVLTVPVNLGEVLSVDLSANPGIVTNASRSVEAYVSGTPILSGAATAWLFYLPT